MLARSGEGEKFCKLIGAKKLPLWNPKRPYDESPLLLARDGGFCARLRNDVIFGPLSNHTSFLFGLWQGYWCSPDLGSFQLYFPDEMCSGSHSPRPWPLGGSTV